MGWANRRLDAACAIVCWLLATVATGCAPPQGGWSSAELEARHPELARYEGHRLSDALPFFVPTADGLTLFLCRWLTRAPLRVRLPSDASESQTEALRAALRAWEKAGLGVRFREVRSAHPDISLRLLDADDDVFHVSRTGDTIADCGVPADFHARAPNNGPVHAEMRLASIYLRRANLDTLGRPQPLSDARLAGEALHELGHALGFPGHVAVGKSVMVREHEVAAHWGRRILAGEPFADASLGALYALPSGAVIGRLDVDVLELRELHRFAGLVEGGSLGEGWRGPFVRVGESSAQILWRDPRWRSASFETLDWRAALNRPGRFALVPNTRAWKILHPAK